MGDCIWQRNSIHSGFNCIETNYILKCIRRYGLKVTLTIFNCIKKYIKRGEKLVMNGHTTIQLGMVYIHSYTFKHNSK